VISRELRCPVQLRQEGDVDEGPDLSAGYERLFVAEGLRFNHLFLE